MTQILFNVIGINELKRNKKVAGRPKDLDDLINLNGI